MAVQFSVELDGKLIVTGRRLLKLSIGELLSFTYSTLVENMQPEDRQKFDEMLLPPVKLETSSKADLIPARLRGLTPPPGWEP